MTKYIMLISENIYTRRRIVDHFNRQNGVEVIQLDSCDQAISLLNCRYNPDAIVFVSDGSSPEPQPEFRKFVADRAIPYIAAVDEFH